MSGGTAGGVTRRRRGVARTGALLLLAGLLPGLAVTGCRSPEPAYYTLAAVPGPAAPGGPRTVEVRRPGLAGYLDRPEIVQSGGPYQLRLAANERWGEPLGDLIGRVLAEELTTRLPGSTVFTSAGSIGADADAAVELDVQRFDFDPSGDVVLLAQVAIYRGRGRAPVAAQPMRIRTRPAGNGTANVVAAMSAALGQAADAVAAQLRGVPSASAEAGPGRGPARPSRYGR